MKPEDARKYADEVARMDNHFSETRIIVDVEVRDEIAATLRNLADQLEYTMRTAEAYKKGLGYARGNLLKLKEDADDFATYAENTLRDGGGR